MANTTDEDKQEVVQALGRAVDKVDSRVKEPTVEVEDS